MHIRKIRSLMLSSAAMLVLSLSPVQAGLFGTSGVKRDIDKILRSPSLSSTNVGIKVISLTTGKTLIRHNDTKLFIPASTVKLVTAYSAFRTLSPQYVFATDYLTDTLVDSATVHTLYIKGYGDPTVTLADINSQALSLSRRIGRIAGDIIVDNSYFDTVRFGHGWMWDEGIVAWNAPISPYALNGNCIDILIRPGTFPGSPVHVRTVPETGYAVLITSAVTSGSATSITIRREETAEGDRFVIEGSMGAAAPETGWKCTVSRPGLYTGTLLKELLTRYGVNVAGNVYEMAAGTMAVTLDRFTSRSLGDVVRVFLKDSDNLTGECILKTMGALHGVPPGSAEKGLAAVRDVLHDIGIKDKRYVIADGSGLSTYNLLSPDIMTQLLTAAYRDFSTFPEYIAALPVAGIDGTLKDRFRESPYARSIRAKTGTMSGVSCIAGYLQTRRGDTLAFSIMMNGFTGSAQPLKAAQDEIIKLLWDHY